MNWYSKWFPGTNLQDLNLDWILKKIAALRGGTAGQYLYKKSNRDFDFGWKTGSGGGGENGYTFTPSVSEEGVISWTNDGDLPNPEPVNIKGPVGNDGTNGSNGATFTPAVSSAGVISWTNDGSLPNPEPVNIKGPAGTNGSNGATFTPAVSSGGVISWTNDGGLPNPESVNIKGETGPAGAGLPSGGTAGDIPVKNSNNNYDVAWKNVFYSAFKVQSYGFNTQRGLQMRLTNNSGGIRFLCYIIASVAEYSEIFEIFVTADGIISAFALTDASKYNYTVSGDNNEILTITAKGSASRTVSGLIQTVNNGGRTVEFTPL